jgi:2'-5' RNA ligase
MKAENPNALEELERFRSIQTLHNHWARPARAPSYYWYVTFENNPELHSLAEQCQQAISFPYYDLTPAHGLHLTLDHIAPVRNIAPERLVAIESAATRACSVIPAFNVTVGALGGTRGAIGFTAYPAQPIRGLRDTLRAATLSAYPDAYARDSEFHPHVAIAYANSDNVPAAEAIEAVEKMNSVAHANVTIKHATLALLERRPRSYAWQTVSRIPLAA